MTPTISLFFVCNVSNRSCEVCLSRWASIISLSSWHSVVFNCSCFATRLDSTANRFSINVESLAKFCLAWLKWPIKAPNNRLLRWCPPSADTLFDSGSAVTFLSRPNESIWRPFRSTTPPFLIATEAILVLCVVVAVSTVSSTVSSTSPGSIFCSGIFFREPDESHTTQLTVKTQIIAKLPQKCMEKVGSYVGGSRSLSSKVFG